MRLLNVKVNLRCMYMPKLENQMFEFISLECYFVRERWCLSHSPPPPLHPFFVELYILSLFNGNQAYLHDPSNKETIEFRATFCASPHGISLPDYHFGAQTIFVCATLRPTSHCSSLFHIFPRTLTADTLTVPKIIIL